MYASILVLLVLVVLLQLVVRKRVCDATQQSKIAASLAWAVVNRPKEGGLETVVVLIG